MSEVERIDRDILFSINRLAAALKMGRDTIAKRLAIAKTPVAEYRAGHAVYRLSDAVPALYEFREDGEGNLDPSKMRPVERRAHYQAENERLKFEQDCGQLILASEVHAEMAAIAKIVVRELENLPDTAERDLRCGPEIVEYLQRKVREIRAEISKRVASEDETDVRASA